MPTTIEIAALLDELDHHVADDLEGQRLDFKEWIARSRDDSVRMAIEMTICMANGGGGTIVLGVRDRVTGRADAIRGVPADVDVARLQRSIYDRTDPKLTVQIEELAVPEGTGRLLLIQVYPGMPPYTDTAGGGKVRVGKDCMPLTGTMRQQLMAATGATDLTAEVVPGAIEALVSAAAMERLREIAAQERAPSDLLDLGDLDLLAALGVLDDGRLTRAGLLLAGRTQRLATLLPNYGWTHLRMRTDTDYADRADGCEALPAALWRITERVMADNPIHTIRQGMFDFEYRTYPEVALREALMNALCHSDYRIPSPVLIRQSPDRLEISNPGAFIGGVSPSNILHHAPVSRNLRLVNALQALRLVNRSNLGVRRMYEAMLWEGKEPPLIEEKAQNVSVTFRASPISAPFRAWVAEEEQRQRPLSVDHLLILQFLLRQGEIDSVTAGRICQRDTDAAREILAGMERQREYLERGGTGRATYFTITAGLHGKLAGPGLPDLDRRTAWEAAKTRVLSAIYQRAERGEPPLANQDVRRLTRLDRRAVLRLIRELEADGHVRTEGKRRWTRYLPANGPEGEV